MVFSFVAIFNLHLFLQRYKNYQKMVTFLCFFGAACGFFLCGIQQGEEQFLVWGIGG
jgi:hypothetical protein